MTATRPNRIVLGLAAAGLAALTAGCGYGVSESAETGRTAARSGMVVAETPAARSAPPAGPPAVEEGREESPVEPVAAGEADSGVALASAERAVPDAVATPEPEADPSKYPGGIVPASPNAKPLPGGERLLVPEREFRAEGRPPALRVSYDDLDLLKVLNVDPVPEDILSRFPSWLTGLDGQRVRLRGFMYPAYEEQLSAFVLTRDTGACCFGPSPKPYYLVPVKMKDGTKARYVESRPIEVVGTFHIAPAFIDGAWARIYKITDAAVAE